ncbi:MAG: hypothetical protein FWG06_01820 [Clostridiales bacterium]|nr:hypothetical protein [Clostridiales bacterium]
MLKKLFRKKRISEALHKSADASAQSPAIYQTMLANIMPEAVETGRVSYATAREQAARLSREVTRQRKVRVVALGMVVSAAALLLFVMPGEQTSLIPEVGIPLAPEPGSVAQVTISCQRVDGGDVHAHITGSEEVYWESIYALDQNGNHIVPYIVYPELELAIFAPPQGNIVIYVPLISGVQASHEYSIK